VQQSAARRLRFFKKILQHDAYEPFLHDAYGQTSVPAGKVVRQRAGLVIFSRERAAALGKRAAIGRALLDPPIHGTFQCSVKIISSGLVFCKSHRSGGLVPTGVRHFAALRENEFSRDSLSHRHRTGSAGPADTRHFSVLRENNFLGTCLLRVPPVGWLISDRFTALRWSP
jgi:hypothetical protein